MRRLTRVFAAGLGLAAGLVACESTPEFAFHPPAHTFTAESVQVDDQAAKVLIARIDAGFFAASPQPLAPLLGRAITADDYSAPHAVALLSRAFWDTRFGADPTIIGRTIRVDTAMVTVVGIMPPGVDVPQGVSLWLPRE